MRPARIPRVVVQHKRRSNERVRPKHLAFVRSLRICVCCGAVGEVDAMHVRAGTDGGMGIKPADRFTLPGCRRCHQRSHDKGELAFWAEIGIDPVDVSCRLWTVTGDREAGLRCIFRARQAIALRRGK